MKLALLSCLGWEGALAAEQAFAREFPPEFDVAVEVWNDPTVDWSRYDCLIFRTVWDYYHFPDEFAAWLEMIERSNIRTLNPIGVVRKNQHKFYLRDLREMGVEIIPTVFIEKGGGLDLSFLADKGWERAIIKPAVSAASNDTRLFSLAELPEVTAAYAGIARTRDLLVQPFMPEIQTSGEVSILFFNDQFSHAVLKTPKAADFRVQSQFGGVYRPYDPAPEVVATAAEIVRKFGSKLLYARVDGVLHNGRFLLMEAELIEPDLYFNLVPDAKADFFQAIHDLLYE